ncbi:hypothetical protein Cs7R123_56790 [Catellatospora sp. TT07R-123]|uniref:septum formation family protein n=1 Tax=Catellatospora sp. TT07R-123 TaxID=2733863 RepID=UPI001B2CE5F1|nr:septum formation family protein [Catellatospora sp. TT07R-123]GHJ48337.1 hypothetical protein Cs7R123_56790 [Catellatospora sp. TT07R-123]
MSARRLALLASATILLAAGCSSAPSSDAGPATPSASAAAETYEPKAGSCLKVLGDLDKPAQDRQADKVVSCTESHDLQIVGAGTLDQGPTTDAMDKAYQDCDGMARRFLHEDWRNGKLEIGVFHTKSASRSDGVRWWECALIPYYAYDSPNSTDQDLSGGIPAKLRYGCQTLNEVNGKLADIHDVACSTPHQAEYTGAIVMPVGTKYPTDAASWKSIHTRCRAVVAAYVGVSKSYPDMDIYSEPLRTRDDWAKRRDVRCFIYLWPKKMTGSAKGTHGKGVPW